jgi:hypothetical protein
VTPHDSRDSDRDTGRQTSARRRVTRDSKKEARDTTVTPRVTDDKPIQAANESGYSAAVTASARPQQPTWNPGSNQAINLTLTKPDTVPMTAAQRKEIISILTSIILDFIQRDRLGRKSN